MADALFTERVPTAGRGEASPASAAQTRHEALEQRPEVKAGRAYQALLSRRPALAAQRRAASCLAARSARLPPVSTARSAPGVVQRQPDPDEEEPPEFAYRLMEDEPVVAAPVADDPDEPEPEAYHYHLMADPPDDAPQVQHQQQDQPQPQVEAPAEAPPQQQPQVDVQPEPQPEQQPQAPTEVGIGGNATSAGPIFTQSLANCIAVVAYNANTRQACMYHYNTVTSFTSEDGKTLVPDLDKIRAAKAVVDAGVGNADAYHIVLGYEWRDSSKLAPTKPAFVEALEGVFAPSTLITAGHTKARWLDGALVGYD